LSTIGKESLSTIKNQLSEVEKKFLKSANRKRDFLPFISKLFSYVIFIFPFGTMGETE